MCSSDLCLKPKQLRLHAPAPTCLPHTNLACLPAPLPTPPAPLPARPPALLQGGSPAAREAAAGAISNLACIKPNQAEIIATGAVPMMLELLGPGSSPGCQEAAGAGARGGVVGGEELQGEAGGQGTRRTPLARSLRFAYPCPPQACFPFPSCDGVSLPTQPGLVLGPCACAPTTNPPGPPGLHLPLQPAGLATWSATALGRSFGRLPTSPYPCWPGWWLPAATAHGRRPLGHSPT